MGKPPGHRALSGALATMLLVATSLEAQVAQWTLRTPTTSPSARRRAASTFDRADGQVLLFGGDTAAGSANDTWSWNGVTWTQRSPTTLPPARFGAAMTYDAARGEVLLFGGQSLAGFHDDTWAWSNGNWTLKSPAVRPPRRVGAAIAYDSARNEVVLFGGWNGAAARLSDTWTWDGTNWQQASPATGPGRRAYAAMAEDPFRQRLVLYGGADSANSYSDTWEWDGTGWSQVSPTGPGPRAEHAMAFFAPLDAVVMHSGTGGVPGGTWLYDGATWTQLLNAAQSPPVLYGETMAYDVVRENIVCFGGGNIPGNADTWVLSAAAGLFAPAPTRTPPAAPLDCNACGAAGHDRPIVNRFSGEFVNSRVDVTIPGRGPNLRWQRTTRSRVQTSATGSGNNASNAYDVILSLSGTDLRLLDGAGNTDRFVRQADGSWVAEGLFRRIVQNGDGSYTLYFENTAQWEFHPTTGSLPGKLRAIRDRNGSTLNLTYDGQGRLARTTDAVGRDTTINYDAAGRVVTVRDCAGRVVSYAYYQSGESGGTPGDVKSVTTPPVTGTPHGNDYPNGKTTTYTYTRGFADPALNSDLLTITDPKGQTYLTNVYAHTIAPSDFRYTTDSSNIFYDRLVRQVLGNAGDVIDWVYEAQTPSATNNYAVIKVIGNDRVGNVTEYFYDAKNNEVIRREYTGRAPDPDGPTTSALNRPTAPLRSIDPAFFETRWQHNADGLVTRVDYPEGNFTRNVYEIDLNPNADPISRGNLREVHRNAGPRGSLSQTVIATFYTYQTGTGGCCGTNFVLTEADGRGAVRTHQYDAAGNRLQSTDRLAGIVHNWTYNTFGQVTSHRWPTLAGRRRVDAFAYYMTGVQSGYVERSVVDSGTGGLALTTTYEYDCVGNVTRRVDPRGNDTVFLVNALDQVVAEYSAEVSPGSGIRYETLIYYDPNDNIVRVDRENRDETGAQGSNTHFSTIYLYEVLNRVTAVIREVTPTTNVVEEYSYDANRNRTQVRKGEAVNGSQPLNIVQTLYDERDLPFRTIRALGSAGQSTTQHDYDRNGNIRFERSGLEAAPRITESQYDGHDRLQDRIDAMGNLHTYRYDANSNLIQSSVLGQLVDDPNPGPRVLLHEELRSFDAADRLASVTLRHFDPTTGTPIGDGASTTTYSYDGRELVTHQRDDRGNVTTFTYDSAHRRQLVEDAKRNETAFTYDANSNVTRVQETELADTGAPVQVFTTTHAYDGLNRRTHTTDSRGNTITTGHDSRGNVVRVLDANSNETRHEYDGMSRHLRTIRDMNGNGASATDPADIMTQQSWDDSSRGTGRTDDNGNATRYVYDALDRMIEERFADGTRKVISYDVYDNPVTTTDANGSVVTATYDQLDRLSTRSIVPGSGVSSAITFEDYQYDGYSRVIRLRDDDSTVQRKYDSMGNVVEERFNGRLTRSTFDGMRNKLSCDYPAGSRVDMVYDALNRLKTVANHGVTLGSYDYVGSDRVEQRVHGNGTRLRLEYDGYAGAPTLPGDFGVKNIVRTLHEKIAGGIVLDDRTYTWDRMGNKTQRRDVRTAGPQVLQQFDYDRAYRMTRSARTGELPTVYALDGVHNRVSPGYVMDARTPDPADFQMNQYTKTPSQPLAKNQDSDANSRFRAPPSKSEARTYDKNGNLVAVVTPTGGSRMLYDYKNQMVEHYAAGKRTTYRYDVLGRRFEKNASGTVTNYICDGDRVIEEYVGGYATLAATYTYGLGIDEPITMLRGGQLYYFHADDQGNVTTLTNTSGDVVERYDYRDFGVTEFFTPNGAALTGSAIGNVVLYNGRWFDIETRYYYFRTRFLDLGVGRFTTRDTIGNWGDSLALGNGCAFTANHPWSSLDPFGRGSWNLFWCKRACDINYPGWWNTDARQGCKANCEATDCRSRCYREYENSTATATGVLVVFYAGAVAAVCLGQAGGAITLFIMGTTMAHMTYAAAETRLSQCLAGC